MTKIPMECGDIIRFKTNGHEIADVRNPHPPKEWTGVMVPGSTGTHVALWCERETREATTIYVGRNNIINNDTLGVPHKTRGKK